MGRVPPEEGQKVVADQVFFTEPWTERCLLFPRSKVSNMRQES